jgi:type II secretory pathway pseudopilin PulG
MSMSIKSLKARAARGLTLIEALMFLGIAAIVIVGAVVLYNRTSNSQRTNEALTQIQSYSTGIKGLYSSVSTYGTGSLVPVVINSRIAPENAVNGTVLTNPWGDATGIMANNKTFQIVYMNVPKDSCVRLLTAGLLSEGSITNMWVVTGTAAAAPTTATTSVPSGTASFSVTARPNPATAATACGSANNNVFLQVR